RRERAVSGPRCPGAGVGGDGLWRGRLESRRAGSVHRLVGGAAPAAPGRPGQPTALPDPALGAGGPLGLAPSGTGPAPLVGGLASPLWPSVVAGGDLRGAGPFAGTAYQAAG